MGGGVLTFFRTCSVDYREVSPQFPHTLNTQNVESLTNDPILLGHVSDCSNPAACYFDGALTWV